VEWVTQAAFAGPTSAVVLDPKTGVRHQLSVVGHDLHFDDPIRGQQYLSHFGRQVQHVGGPVEVAVTGF
jgi:hypothetical protein